MQMAPFMMEIGAIIKLMELEHTPGRTVKFTKDNGKAAI